MEHTLDSTLLHLTRTRLTRDYPGQINACLDVLTNEEIWWRPHEQANAVANLVVHLGWSNRYYLEEAIAGRPVARNRDAEFAARGGLSKTALRETWDQAVRIVSSVLDTITPEQMMETTDRTGKRTTFAQILLHVTHHNANHMGQIVWVTKMLHPGAIDDIWMKTRGR